LTLDRVILHTVMHHSSTSTYTPNFIEIEETFCKWTDGRTFFYPYMLLGRLPGVDLKMHPTNCHLNHEKYVSIHVSTNCSLARNNKCRVLFQLMLHTATNQFLTGSMIVTLK